MSNPTYLLNSRNFCSNISLWIGAIIAIMSLKPWFGWAFDFNLFLIPIFISLRILCFRKTYSFSIWISFLFFIPASIFLLQLFSTSIPSSIKILVYIIIPIVTILFMSPMEKRILLNRTINIYCIILLISLFGFIMFKIGVPLLNSPIDNPNPVYSNFTNYYFFTLSLNLGIFTRFSSMFIEPGHVGMINSIILFIIGYKIQNFKSLLLTITLIWTFSLAGYLLYLIGLSIRTFCVSSNLTKTIAKLIGIIIFIGSVGTSLYVWNRDNPFSIMILSRLDVDSSGNFSGNNRTTGNFNSYYKQFESTDEFFTGIGANRMYKYFYGTPNTSYKTFILENGIIAMMFLLLFFLIYLWAFPSRLGFGLLILLIAAFIQRPYILWPIESYIALSSITIFSQKYVDT